MRTMGNHKMLQPQKLLLSLVDTTKMVFTSITTPTEMWFNSNRKMNTKTLMAMVIKEVKVDLILLLCEASYKYYILIICSWDVLVVNNGLVCRSSTRNSQTLTHTTWLFMRQDAFTMIFSA